jgi:peptide chain release factor 2
MTPQDKRNVDTVKNSIKLIKDFAKFDESRARAAELEQQSAMPNFWDNAEVAVQVMKEKDRLNETTAPVMQLEAKLSELVELMELAEAEGDEVLVSELSTSLEELAEHSVSL